MATLRSRREMSPRRVRFLRLLTTGKPWYLVVSSSFSAGRAYQPEERKRKGRKGTHEARRE
jgi:hypothetical protein